MKKTIFLLVFFCSIATYAQETTTYYFIRHAEKNRADVKNKDPYLNLKGLNRADFWAEVLAPVKFDMVYTTKYNRTKQTALPVAKLNKLPLLLYNPSKMYDDAFKNNTNGKTVLVVGHSNTTPAFVNKILGEKKYKDIDDSNNANLYIVTVTKGGATSVLIKVPFKE